MYATTHHAQGEDATADVANLKAKLSDLAGGVIDRVYVVNRYGYDFQFCEMCIDMHAGQPLSQWDGRNPDFVPAMIGDIENYKKILIVVGPGTNPVYHCIQQLIRSMLFGAGQAFDEEGWKIHFDKIKDAGSCCILM